MNDFDWDVLQKKRIARGAIHMKNGSKSRKCSLPSDNLTPAQLKRRNGPVAVYKLDAPMTWEQFKEMPKDLKVKYINNMRELYGATDQMLADMFGIHFSYVNIVRRELGIEGRASAVTKAERERRLAMWEAFCNGVVGGAPEKCENSHESDAEKCEDPEVEEIIEGFKEWSESIEPEPDIPVVEEVPTPLDLQ